MAQSLETLWTVLARDTVAVDAARVLADAVHCCFTQSVTVRLYDIE